MRWLIVEDALKDRTGHWHEYVAMFLHQLRALGDEVEVLTDRNAEPFIQTELGAKPVLPPSIWHRHGDGAGPLTRLWRFPAHALATYRALKAVLRNNPDRYDLIFVPTTSAYHLLGWAPIVKRVLRGRKTRVLLFFIQIPAEWPPGSDSPQWSKSPTTFFFNRALNGLKPSIDSGQVILGAEPAALRDTLTRLCTLPVTLFPQPVHRHVSRLPRAPGQGILMACYGAARAEKGSDLLQQAILLFLERNPETSVRFALQWVTDFTDDQGRMVRLDPCLRSDPRVEVIPRYFQGDEYSEHLARTDVMLLPYRLRAYQLRGSRVAVEAMVNGIPVIATQSSTFAQQLADYGSRVEFADGDVEGLVAAITTMSASYPDQLSRATERQSAARSYFSVAAFRSLLPRGEVNASPN